MSKQAPVTQHALPKRFGFRIASHGAALAGPGADSRSEPRHKTLAGLKMLIAGLGQQRRSEPSRTAIPITWGCIEPRVFPEKLLQQNINVIERAATARF